MKTKLVNKTSWQKEKDKDSGWHSGCICLCWGFPAQSTQWGHVSLPNHMFTGQAYSSKRLTSIVHILSPETDNCSSWISGRERMTVETISWSISTKECCRPRRGLNPRPLVSSRMAHPTEPPRPAILGVIFSRRYIVIFFLFFPQCRQLFSNFMILETSIRSD